MDKLQILSEKLVELSFSLNPNISKDKENKGVEPIFNMFHSYENGELTVDLSVDINQNILPFFVYVKYSGVFSLGNKDYTDEQLKRVATINCAAILFPFVREIIANVTRRGRFNPLILPPMNFVEIYENIEIEESNGKVN